MNYPDFLVYIDCTTYNHASYIEDAMNGFCMQETTFPFVATIIDDASTDGEQNVIKRYLEENFDFSENAVARKWETDDAYFIYAQHKTNKNCYFAVVLLKYNFWQLKKDKTPLIREWRDVAKYVAFCEGDDYWTKKEKLQKQIDYLEKHYEYTMCFHDVDIKAEKNRDWYNVFGKLEDRDYTGLENIITWSVPTCSIVCRNDVYNKIPVNPNFTMGDNVIVLTCSRYGRIRCIPQKMGIYRLTPTSWIGGQSDKVQRYKYISHYKGLIEEFEECRCESMYNVMELQYFQLLSILKFEGNKDEFEKIRSEYFDRFGKNTWHLFRKYYIKDAFRRTIKLLLGDKIISCYRKVKSKFSFYE